MARESSRNVDRTPMLSESEKVEAIENRARIDRPFEVEDRPPSSSFEGRCLHWGICIGYLAAEMDPGEGAKGGAERGRWWAWARRGSEGAGASISRPLQTRRSLCYCEAADRAMGIP